MLIQQNKNSEVHIELENVPAILYFTINGQTFRYGLNEKCLDNECPYNTNIVNWMQTHIEEIKDILWNWSLDKEITEITDAVV